ncbi:UDP-3-O-(3-hydroxymyristoyl)glucosamine N-acyltransferase [Fulvivirga sp. RKSG066]|uniref:UDP-3-O-(3-hydroxymyristoyl)glucosamine N-acyltransferase n=1 Tax=Fulvivirga aurantia TaxID=2529383 RepID=UPI0012BBB9A4|nr:UDP-3-O-(3-hydroxymyristoyl)glucosamine N-acyltransferase [Fulvivirga aurantia]MTI21373.1 UDP-3-O-(3-hydroxymyristoyl)glucosamine N-acyltransferase [Fulvivirga aurantia]
MEFTVEQIATMLEGEVKGDGSKKINMLAKIQDAGEGQISFLSNPKYEQFIYETQASAVIVKKDFSAKREIKPSLILVDDPYTSFTRLLEEYHKFISYQKSGIEEPSFIGENATVGSDVYRGAFSYIGNNVTIGDNVKVYPHAYIGDNVTIGDNSIIHPSVKLYADTKVGANCVIHSGVVVGSDGFGFAPQQDGTYKTIPQLGNVIIGDNVDIGSNTVIDCATFHGDSTKINNGVKLDNLIQVAHNVEIGSNTVIAAQTGISGSTEIGSNCVIGGQVGIAGHLKIASKTSIAAQSGIGKDTAEKDVMFGSPAFDHKDYIRSYIVFRKLPDLSRRLKQLEEKVLDLPSFQEKS